MSKGKAKFIPIENVSRPTAQPRLVSYEEFDRHRKILDWTFGFIVAAFIILLTSFVVFIVDAWKFHSQTLIENTRTIEALKHDNQDIKFSELQKQIDELKKSSSNNNQTPTKPPKQNPRNQ